MFGRKIILLFSVEEPSSSCEADAVACEGYNSVMGKEISDEMKKNKSSEFQYSDYYHETGVR